MSKHQWRAPSVALAKSPPPVSASPLIEPHLETRLETIAAPIAAPPLHERLAQAAREAERQCWGPEAQVLNAALVALQMARYQATQGVVTSDSGLALVAEIAAL